MTKRHRDLTALISTIQPIDGGVPTMTRWICKLLEELGITPILGWYAPWRNFPSLSVPVYKLLSGSRPGIVRDNAFGQYDSYGIGSWLPELEFTNYMPNNSWKKIISQSQLHISVSGNALCASPYVYLNKPFLSWVATPWEADRLERVKSFILPRRLLDSTVNSPVLRALEKKILNAPKGEILSLSKYTARELKRIGKKEDSRIMYMPINTALFSPRFSKTVAWRIGFSGRYCDPRKNIGLLLGAIRILVDLGHNVELILVGERKKELLIPLIKEFRLNDNIFCYSNLKTEELANMLQTFDIFAIPSHQEGLCIAGLEAMACGVPVVSTRCGGPEDYVQPGITGELVENSSVAFASVLKDLCMNRVRRQSLASAAVDWVNRHASEDASRKIFRQCLKRLAQQEGYKIM